MSDDLDLVLRLVASGELTPDEALARLGEAPAAAAAPSAAPAPSPSAAAPSPAADSEAPAWGTPSAAPGTSATPAPAPEDGAPVRAVRVNASYRSVDVIGDASVATAVAVGAHAMRRDGDTLVVESAELPPLPEAGEQPGGGRFSFAVLPRSLAWARSFKDHHLVVRVNPALALEVDAAGAAVRVSGLEGGVRLRLVASAAKIDRLRGPLDVDALTSSVKGSAAPTGASRIACESSSVKLQLDPGTDVHIRARNRMSKVVLPSAVSKGGLVDPDLCEAVVGDGTGELGIEAVMSSIVLGSSLGASAEAAR
jgi:hypothetical protein